MPNLTHTSTFSPADATSLAANLYGIIAAATPLPGERDQNFRLDTPTGEAFVLKIANGQEDAGLLEAQTEALRRVEATGICPRVLPAKDGRLMTPIDGADGSRHWVRLLTFLPGTPLAQQRRQTPGLWREIGRRVAQVDAALADFDPSTGSGHRHPAIHRNFDWNLAQGLAVIDRYAGLIDDPAMAALVEKLTADHRRQTALFLPDLPQQVIHNDANDYNVLVGGGSDLYSRNQQVVGLIDFGDLVHSYRVGGLAVAAAYAVLDKADPLAAAAEIVAGYNEITSLTQDELAALWGLIRLRLCVSVCMAAHQRSQRPDDEYLAISQQPIQRSLPRLATIHPRFAESVFRNACGLTPLAACERLAGWLGQQGFAPVMEADGYTVFDLSVGSPLLNGDEAENSAERLDDRLNGQMRVVGASVGVGRYDEARLIYTAGMFDTSPHPSPPHCGEGAVSAGPAMEASTGTGPLPGPPQIGEGAVLARPSIEESTDTGPHPSPPQIGEGAVLARPSIEESTDTAPPPVWGRLGGGERRTIHLGIDLFAPTGTPVHAPLAGTVHSFADNAGVQDYGPVIVLSHASGDGETFYTLYGHLSRESLDGLEIGQTVAAGAPFATLGSAEVNGGWPPHLHFQIVTDLLGLDTDFPGVGTASQREVWKAFCPDPNLILGIPTELFPPVQPTKAETLAARRARIGGNLSIGYRQPVKVVRGWRQFLYDETGRCYLDAYNNVPHVGHCHPRIVRAAQEQMTVLNTNTRYLHDNLTRYAERLATTLPDPLNVCFFLNSASEANELALRLVRAHTGRREMIVLEGAYHGNSSGLIDISPYKHDGPGGMGAPDWVYTAPVADIYRGPFKADNPLAGAQYAAGVQAAIQRMQAAGRNPGGFIAESCPSVGGQIFFPPGYLADVYRYVRAAGGICIADEVQTGYGRIGTRFYAFEAQGVVPDVVVLGKPIGNGHPLAALITTAEIAASFDNGMEFFSTFGGNPVSCAVGLAVLDVVTEEGLQEHARRVGEHLLAGLRPFAQRFPLVGDVRGSGLFLGVELVRDRETLEPAPAEASYVANRMREEGILLGTDGPLHNVVKIRPPMPFGFGDADRLVETFERILDELTAG
ncbi:MAG: aminotransferase class III-fold pyridoxal phosphate-dependent enzyme [Caldilineaceae bacterium]|nr:aminotransferase class III-fold pyridoxal phosphate-dependent enzyme [Caldilineaceae bacterium]